MQPPKVMAHLKPAHISCSREEIAPIVIMPGDPLRAKYISEKYLEDAKLINTVRNMYGYTGTYKGTRITVMAHGMGMPSVSIYAFELLYFFGVKKIIRIGTCGALDERINVPELIIASDSYTEANFAYSYNGDPTHIAYPSENLTSIITKKAQEKGLNYHVGTVMCTEQFGFYSDNEHVLNRVPKDIHLLGEEMETFALFHIANSFKAESAAILTVVDSKFNEDFLTPEQREKSLDDMITLALDSIVKED